MKYLAIAITLIACSKKDTPAPDPKPVDPVAAAPKPPEPKPEPVMPDPNKPAPAAACTVQIKVTSDKITYDGGGVKGEIPFKSGATIDMAPLKPAVGKCDANIWADDDIAYQDVIAVMDSTVHVGIVNIGLGSPTDKPVKNAKPSDVPPATPPAGWTMTTTKTPDGKLQITGKFDPSVKDDLLKNTPLIIISKKDVTVFGKSVGKPADPNLDSEIVGALPPNPKNPTVILQADRELPFSTIAAAVKAASTGGYDNVLFAVKNK